MRRILIANRGEIAVRLQKSMHKLGIETVLVYHESEKKLSYLQNSSISVSLGNGSITETFLNISKLLDIAKQYKCDAIHPGYGFLSENYLFARACEKNNIKFIGPSSEVIRLMSSKSEAKNIASKVGIPILKSIVFSSIQELGKAELIYPILIKAVAGGGGKGMKIVRKEKELKLAIESARREALQYFGDDKLLAEPYLENARHIEVQVVGDYFGNFVHLFERECSVQRNHQKVIEEAPAVSLTEELRNKLYSSALLFATELNYSSIGTIEFLVSGSDFYFLEMNTRIQVEHGVTELVTGIDMVEEQINISKGLPLSNHLKSVGLSGHAIEVRICAEDPYKHYKPSVGKIFSCHFPSDVRVDTYIEDNTTVTSNFDSMLAKVIVHTENRNDAITQLSEALNKTVLFGINSNIYFLKQILQNQLYRKNLLSTNFLQSSYKQLIEEYTEQCAQVDFHKIVIAFILNNFIGSTLPSASLWQCTGSIIQHPFVVNVNDGQYTCSISENSKNLPKISIDDNQYFVGRYTKNKNSVDFELNNEYIRVCFCQTDGRMPFDIYQTSGIQFHVFSTAILSMALATKSNTSTKRKINTNRIISPLYGKIIDIKVKENDIVKKGDILLTIDSMKTENHILAPHEGIVDKIFVKPGLQIKENSELLIMNPINM